MIKGLRRDGFVDLEVNKRIPETSNIDFQFWKNGKLAATCEFKGHARAKLLTQTENGWFWGLTRDVAKQFYRCHRRLFSDVEHYVSIPVVGAKDDVEQLFETYVMKPLNIIFPRTLFGQVVATQITVTGMTLTLFIFRVDTNSKLRCG